MQTPMRSDNHNQRAYVVKVVRPVLEKDWGCWLLPIIVNDRDSRHGFSFEPNPPLPAWSQATTFFNNQRDEVLVSGVFCAWRGKFRYQSNCPLEDGSFGPRAWL